MQIIPSLAWANLLNSVWCAPTQQLTEKPLAMLRWVKIRGGTVACSGFQTWIKTKAIKSTKAITSNAMIRLSVHWIRSAFVGLG
jgi:hypothetical protein